MFCSLVIADNLSVFLAVDAHIVGDQCQCKVAFSFSPQQLEKRKKLCRKSLAFQYLSMERNTKVSKVVPILSDNFNNLECFLKYIDLCLPNVSILNWQFWQWDSGNYTYLFSKFPQKLFLKIQIPGPLIYSNLNFS